MVAGTEDVLGSSLESRPSATMTANITPEAIKEAWTQLQALENTSLLTAGARDTEKELNIIRDFLSKVPIPLLFACLDSVAPVRGEQTRQAAVKEKAFKLATKSLDRVFQSPEGPSILANHEIHAYLLFGMNHPAHAIREFTLRQMARAMTASEQRFTTSLSSEIHVIGLTFSNDLILAVRSNSALPLTLWSIPFFLPPRPILCWFFRLVRLLEAYHFHTSDPHHHLSLAVIRCPYLDT